MYNTPISNKIISFSLFAAKGSDFRSDLAHFYVFWVNFP